MEMNVESLRSTAGLERESASMAKRTSSKGPESTLPRGVETVTDLAQIRALADPLRLKILGALSGLPRTTKQVAQVLGEKPTKLYHHVEALKRVGLVRLTETRPNRGTMEKYFQAVAAQFQVSASALSPGGGKARSAQESMLTSILDTARRELNDCIRPGSLAEPDPDQAPFVARILLKGSSRKVQGVRRRILRLIEALRADAADTAGTVAGSRHAKMTYSCTIVFCPTCPPDDP
jgi:DNA-binding transcriptional ArsR family regulator